MPRVKRGFKARRRRNRVLRQTKGFRAKRKSCHAISAEALHHALQHQYRGRKERKRDFRRLWITRINAGARAHGVSYSKLMGGLGKRDVALNRKMLAEIAISDPVAFQKVIATATS